MDSNKKSKDADDKTKKEQEKNTSEESAELPNSFVDGEQPNSESTFYKGWAGAVEKAKREVEVKLSNEVKKSKELEQDKIILKELSESSTAKSAELEKSKQELEKKLDEKTREVKEIEQQRNILKEISESKENSGRKMSRKSYVTMAVIAIAASSLFVGYQYFGSQLLADTTPHLLSNYNFKYILENKNGDVVDTWVIWYLYPGRALNVGIVNNAGLLPDKIDTIKNTIVSTDTITIDDSLVHKGPAGTSSVYYKGWQGALRAASLQPNSYDIPIYFNIAQSSKSDDVTITLTNDTSPDGLSAITRSVEDSNHILKTKITIFGASQFSTEQLGGIMRHEFGHAIGLADSTTPEDLMHSTIQTDYPYISGCDVDAIKGLYNGNERSQVVCQK